MKKTTTIMKNLKVAMDIATKQGTSMQHKTNYKKKKPDTATKQKLAKRTFNKFTYIYMFKHICKEKRGSRKYN